MRKLTKKEQKFIDAETQKLVYGWEIPMLKIPTIARAAEMAFINGLPLAPAIEQALISVGARKVA